MLSIKKIARIIGFSVAAAFLHADVYALPDIVFVTQPPHPRDFATINATFANHLTGLDAAPRGGDLYIRYSDGSLKNITEAAGFGMAGFQGVDSIAVRDPAVHWNGEKILFSMLLGAPTQRYQVNEYFWQLYEVTGIGKSATPVITKVANQPENYNNVMGIYGTDERIIFVSDRPRGGLEHTYPQRDEYESTPTNTGLWSLEPESGDLIHLDHAPSGDFHPILDSFGRVLFTRWDHLQRDQQNRCSQPGFGAFNYASEAAEAALLDSDEEVFPEARANCEISDESHNLDLHSFNLFLPWQVNEDGTELETINHIGRHELVDYIGKSFNDDGNVEEFYHQYSRVNQNSIDGFFQIQEDPNVPGLYYGVSAPEFGTHASGQIIKMSLPPSTAADQASIVYVTHPDTQNTDDTPAAEHIGLSRDPLPMSDGALVASHSSSTRQDSNIGTSTAPESRYAYRLKEFDTSGQYAVPGGLLTSGIVETISYWSPDELITYNNVTMWELQPREIRSRSKPARLTASLPDPENSVLEEAGIDEQSLRSYLRENNLALIVSRNVTTRDNLDHQQPLNLRVAGAATETIKESGKIYEIAHFQIFQGDLIRGYGGIDDPSDGRRVLAQPLHSVDQNPENPEGPAGSVRIAADGSLAALVPAQQAITYQLTDEQGNGVVRERLWLTFQPGEIRICASCHGVNSADQIGNSAPETAPQALRDLLDHLKNNIGTGGNPEMTLEVSKASGRGRATRLKLTVTGTNSEAASKEISFSVSIGKRSCGDVHSASTDTNGNYTFTSGKIPGSNKKTRLRFSLQYNQSMLDEADYTLKKSSGKRMSKSKRCQSVAKAFQ